MLSHKIDPVAPIMAQLREIGLPEHLPHKCVMVYRFFNSSFDLLYVGVTNSPRGRWQSHKNRAAWWPDVASVCVEWHASNNQALDSEVDAIRSEMPRFNRRSALASLMRYSCGPHESRTHSSPLIRSRRGIRMWIGIFLSTSNPNRHLSDVACPRRLGMDHAC